MHLNQIGEYWDSRAEGYSLSIHEQLKSPVCEDFRCLLKNSAPAGEGLRCLDIGCGPGFFTILLAREGHKLTAVDYSEGMLDQAKRNFAKAGIEATALQGDAQNLPFADESFDYIVSRNLVWNLERPEAAYREWLRLLKPGGRLFVADANHYLYYYDKDYSKAKEAEADTAPHNCYGVDPSLINEIARDLPLSRERRPEWDLNCLMALGMTRLNVQVSHRRFIDSESGAEKKLVADFIVCAEKPLDGKRPLAQDEQRQIDDQWTASADNYDSIIHDELQSFRAPAWTERILGNAPQKACLDVLDAGCGPGFFSILLAKAGHRAVGLDGSAGMLRHAAENAADQGVFPLFLKGDCHSLPFADKSFDLVVSRNVTHALRDHRAVYAEWRRVLRPGGVLLIFDANWHLMQTDLDVRREFAAREKTCIACYGSNFSGGRREVENCETVCAHRLGSCKRPHWDLPLLAQAGFQDVSYEENITDGLWDDKEKLLYGATPLFMIRAVKA